MKKKRFKKITTPKTKKTREISEAVRLNKYIATSGICSRRQADDLIAKGMVKINGKIVSELGSQVQPGDEVFVNGKRISPEPFEYIILNKPVNTITTLQDEKDRATVMDLINLEPSEKVRLFPVGRLDRDTVGALLITNDGELANRLMHPRYQIGKLYEVKTADSVKPHELAQLEEGIVIEGETLQAAKAAYIALPDYHRVGILLHEGKNRQIRRMFEALGHTIKQLERVQYAGLTVNGIRRGKWRRLFKHEVRQLKKLVKLK